MSPPSHPPSSSLIPPQLLMSPGFHSPTLTDALITALAVHQPVLPVPLRVSDFLARYPDPVVAPPIGILAFSAGVVATVPLLWRWQQAGGQVAGLIALDGWGVPLLGDYPIYRLSHDRFTHRSSLPLGSGPLNFYADPPVPHLALWQSPQTALGWQVEQRNGQYRVSEATAIAFIGGAWADMTGRPD
ncbi:MAG: hypothetical protein AAFY78_19540 [Cyanobacteria bacterium J06648_16]